VTNDNSEFRKNNNEESQTMKTQGVLTYVEEQPQVDFRLADIEETMNEAEKTEATVLTYNFQVIEPGLDKAYTFRMPADLLPKGFDFDQALFLPVEVDARGLDARAFIRNNGAKSVSADLITFRAMSIRPLERDELLKFNRDRAKLVKDQKEQRSAWSDQLEKIRQHHDERIAKMVGAATEAASKSK